MIKFYSGFCVLLVACIVLSAMGLGLGVQNNILVTVLLMVVLFGISGVNIVNEWDRRPVMRLGKYRGEIGPGLCWINPLLDSTLEDTNVYDEVASIVITSVQTKDNIPLSFELVLTTQIINVRKSVVEVDDLYEAIDERARASANGTIRAHDLSEILHTGGTFSEQILKSLKEKVSVWGVDVKSIEIKDLKIVDEAIQQAISMKARAQKEAEAELARAIMQKQIAEQLNEAADVLDNEGWRLKSLEVLLKLCQSGNNNTIIIPSDLQSLAQVLTPRDLGK